MSSNTASSPVARASKAKAPKTSTTAKKSATKKSASKTTTAAHPSWKTIITECITVHKDQARSGVSRQLIKKFASDKYRLEPTATNISHLNHAITHGAEKGIFLLPKGPSGCVKLSAAGKAKGASDENTKPAQKPSAKSTKVVKVAKSTKSNPTTTSKKTSSAKTVKKTASAKASAAKSKATSAPKAKSRTTKVKT